MWFSQNRLGMKQSLNHPFLHSVATHFRQCYNYYSAYIKREDVYSTRQPEPLENSGFARGGGVLRGWQGAGGEPGTVVSDISYSWRQPRADCLQYYSNWNCNYTHISRVVATYVLGSRFSRYLNIVVLYLLGTQHVFVLAWSQQWTYFKIKMYFVFGHDLIAVIKKRHRMWWKLILFNVIWNGLI